MSFKIPAFARDHFHQLSESEQATFVKNYRSWYKSPISQLLVKDFNSHIEKLVKEDEQLSGKTTEFELTVSMVRTRAIRKFLRTLLKDINPEVNNV